MKVLLINGSPRRQGNTHMALSEIARQLNELGIDTEIAWIGTKPVRGCIACGTCSKRGNGQCVFNDDICNEMIQKVNEADGLVVGSPTYYAQPAGQLLCLLQRMFYAGGKSFQNKPAAAVIVCRRGGATAAMQTLQMPFQMTNMPIVSSQYWNIAYGRNPGEVSQDAEGLQTMRTLARNMAWMLRSLHRDEAPQHEPWQPTNFIR